MSRVGGSLIGMLLLLVTPALAQDADRIELKGVVGTTGFVDSPGASAINCCYPALISF